MFPELREEIAKKRKELAQGVIYNQEQRHGEEYANAMKVVCWKMIGGSETDKLKFFNEAIKPYPDVYWIDGCDAPRVRDHKIGFHLKANAIPKARQPIPLSAYDRQRLELHLEENVVLGKLRKLDPTNGDPLPEWTTPVFIVDQDAKGALGRMVCAYGLVNSAMELPSFPSADPKAAFDRAAGCGHLSLVDALWGYTQFEITDATKELLCITTHLGLYEWTRMPFGPAPAPAEMQASVHTRFGTMTDEQGQPFISPCMDDLLVTSVTLREHIWHMRALAERARTSGFEFKLKKGQFNQETVEFWGCLLSKDGRKPQPKKIEQMTKWPEPRDQGALTSFLAFVNYLREYMPPALSEAEAVLKPFRKKDVDFRALWDSDAKYLEAFKSIREMAVQHVVLEHIDHASAARPEETGRPLEMFVDASIGLWVCGSAHTTPRTGTMPENRRGLRQGILRRTTEVECDGA
jgi:hypothetical protein